jgi:hypothetical protein
MVWDCGLEGSYIYDLQGLSLFLIKKATTQTIVPMLQAAAGITLCKIAPSSTKFVILKIELMGRISVIKTKSIVDILIFFMTQHQPGELGVQPG